LSRGDRSRPGRERTAAERERDRLERARRRADTPEAPIELPEPPTGPALPPDPLVPPAPLEPPTVESWAGAQEPAVPIEQPLPPAAQPLPPAPPSAPAAQPPSPGAAPLRPRRGRSPLARIAAVLALVAVIAALVALLHSSSPKHVAAPAPPPVVKVLIPEGKTRAQITEIAADDGLKGDYRAASRRSLLLNPAAYGAPHGTPDLEGFLFPATYDMDKGAPVARLVEEQLVAFQENFGVSEIARAHALHVTPYQLLIVASMVEREAQIPGDRPKIAAVIYNRLAAGMPLGIDASIYYAVELQTGIATYTKELTEAQLHIDSPYNTRTHVGLPPTPISNPGVASIEAAAHPAHVSYLYYVAGADGCGEQVFSHTLAEFEVDAAAYKAAVARAGGHPPTCKRK
jgi:cell division protein YceG involved in septum cleavage